MIFALLLILKTIFFTYVTKIEYNKIYIVLTSTLFIFTIFSLIRKKDKNYNLSFILYSIFSFIIFIDVLHFTYFNVLPSISMISQVGQVIDVKDSLIDIFTFKNLLFVVDLPILFFLNKKIKINNRLDNFLNINIKQVALVNLSILIILLVNILLLNNKNIFKSITNQELFIYHTVDILDTVFDSGDKTKLSLEDREYLIEDIKKRSTLTNGKLHGIGKGKNLIVIQVESLQNFVIGLEYKGQEITPNLNSIIKDSSTIYFDQFYQMIGKGNTSDAEFSTNNSLYPSMTGPSYVDYEKNDFNGLPWLLRDKGYTAWAFHGYKKNFWNRDNAYKAQGFERYINEDDFNVSDEDIIGFGLNDEKFFNMSRSYINELNNLDENPFYAFMITLTSHNPYKMPKKDEHLYIEERYKDTILGDYFQSIHYTDMQIGKFIEGLKEDGIYEDTIFVIYGDHFGISAAHEDYKNLMDDFLGYDYSLKEMQNIPLLIHIPNEDINQTVSKVSSHLDFLPTIANLMDIDLSNSIIFGRDILNYNETNYVATQTYMIKGSFISDNEIFIMSRDGVFSNSKVYDMKTNEPLDPEDYRSIYEKLTSEINMCDYILNNNLYNDILSGNYNFDIKSKLDISSEVTKDEGKLLFLENNSKGSYIVDVWYDEDNSKFIFGDNMDIYKFTDLVLSNTNPKIVLRFDSSLDFERVRRLFTNILRYTRENNLDALTGLFPIARTYDEYHYLKTLGHEPIADLINMNLTDEQLKDFIINLDLNIALVNNPIRNRKLLKYLYKNDIYIFQEKLSNKIFKFNKYYFGYIEK